MTVFDRLHMIGGRGKIEEDLQNFALGDWVDMVPSNKVGRQIGLGGNSDKFRI